MGIGIGAQTGVTFEAGASRYGGTGNSQGSTQVNTYIDGVSNVTVRSGGNTTLAGAVVTADHVKVDVGGNLNIESRQDTATAAAKESSAGASASVCIPPLCYGAVVMGSVSGGNARGTGSYASVNEQSGIQAGDGGFDVNVKGNTNLSGGVIASTDAAVDGGKNSFNSASLTMNDIVNTDSFSANGFSLTAGYNATSSTGFGHASSGSTSITSSGISGVAGNAAVRTGDGSNGLTPSWVADELLKDVNAQVQITSTATGILIQMTPQILDAITKLMGGGSPPSLNQVEQARDEIVDILKDPALTEQQRAQLAALLDFVKVGEKYLNGIQGQSGGADTVVGGRLETTPAQFVIPWAAAGSGGAAGAGAAGLGSAAGSGYRDPETGQWIGASPLNFPPLSAVEDLVRTNPVLALFYIGYQEFLGVLQAMQSSGKNEGQTTGGVQADTYGTPPNGASPPPDGEDRNPTRDSRFNSDGEMLGKDGVQSASDTLLNRGSFRVDFENPNPGQRPGQIHVQSGGEKYIYNVNTNALENVNGGSVPRSVQRLLNDPQVQRAINKGLQYLGEKPVKF